MKDEYDFTNDTQAKFYLPSEECLAQKVIEKKSEEWLAQNQDAIHDYNKKVSLCGVFGDGLKRF